MEDIRNIVSSFSNCLDLKNWESIEQLLANEIKVENLEIQGTKERMRASEFVKMHEEALEDLKTQHLISNIEVSIFVNEANCRANTIIFKKGKDKNCTTHAIYDFILIREDEDWLIHSISQKVLWIEGDYSLRKVEAS